jgi:hypothetical protein
LEFHNSSESTVALVQLLTCLFSRIVDLIW